MVIEQGCASPLEAISATAASTGTVGWHTEITWRSGDRGRDPLAHVVDVVVEVERPLGERHHARIDPVDPYFVVDEQRAHVSRNSVAWCPESGAGEHLSPLGRRLAEVDQPAERLSSTTSGRASSRFQRGFS